MKAEFLSYGMLSIMSLFVEGLKKYVLTSTKKAFFSLNFCSSSILVFFLYCL